MQVKELCLKTVHNDMRHEVGLLIPWRGTNTPLHRTYMERKFIGKGKKVERKRKTVICFLRDTEERDVGGACPLKEPLLHLYRVRALPAMRAGVVTLPLPDPKGTGTGLCLPACLPG